MSAEFTFVPAPGLANGHAMTLYAWARRRQYPGLPAADIRLIRVDADSQVRADCYWQPDPTTLPTLLGLHGLEGSSESHYMRGVAHKAWRAGWNVVLLNQRNCGNTEHLTPGLYHSGLTADPIAVLRSLMTTDHLTSFALAGYSLGGNLTLKLAGELSLASDLPIHAVAAVSPTIDLALCVDAIEWRQNTLYQWNFLKGLKARMRRKAALFPGHYDVAPLRSIRTIRQFDDVYTAPSHGFGTAKRYYELASARPGLAHITVPALILAAEDDPFVPHQQFVGDDLQKNSRVTISVQRHGGHCGFVARAHAHSDGYWAEQTVVDFLTAQMVRAGRLPAPLIPDSTSPV
jgi:predicted alpha/beta-fold hydrolase